MWQECQITLQHTRPCYAKSSYRSVDPQALHGNVHQADHVPNGPTNSAATTTMFQLRLCGGKPLVAVTRDRRYGPSRLRVNDDDEGVEVQLRCLYLLAALASLTKIFANFITFCLIDCANLNGTTKLVITVAVGEMTAV